VDAKELGLVDIIQTSDDYLIQQSKANRRILKISCDEEKTSVVSKLLDGLG
jgi:ClpP class serine protease